jgi:pimeloyl-ACP methyl ester carboxylesterase
VDSAVSDLDAFHDAERVVLVGHSMAGITIPAVAARRPNRIAQLVFVSCGIPREGGSLAGELPLWIQLLSTWLSQKDAKKARKPMRPWLARYMFGNDMDADQTAFMLARLVPEATGFLTEAVSRKELPAADVLPRTYIKLLRDHALRPKLQDRFITHLGECQVRTLDSGHDAMISHPKELAAILNVVKNNEHSRAPSSR